MTANSSEPAETDDILEPPEFQANSSLKNILLGLFWCATLGLTIAVLLAMFARRWWFADLFTHFRLQGFIAGVILLSIGVSVRYWKISAVLMILIVYQGLLLAPYFVPEKHPELPEASHSLLIWNVYVGNEKLDEVVQFLQQQDSDVILLLEVSPELGVKLDALTEKYPHSQISSSHDAFGCAFFSRLPLEELSIQRVGEELVNTITARFSDGTTLIGVHTLPPAGRHYSMIRNQQLTELSEWVASQAAPVIVAGDLNITPWSPHFQELLQTAGLRNPRRRRGLLTSWPSDNPLTRIPIDHILPTAAVSLGDLSVLSESCGSDHFPLVCRWSIPSETP